jgi:hypothetical protein
LAIELHAFVEVTSGIVRVGPACRAYGDPWEGSVAFSCVDGRTAVVKALQAKGFRLGLGHLKATTRALAEHGLVPSWERVAHPSGHSERKSTMEIQMVLKKDDGTEMMTVTYHNLEYADAVDAEEAISAALVALGRKRLQGTVKK